MNFIAMAFVLCMNVAKAFKEMATIIPDVISLHEIFSKRNPTLTAMFSLTFGFVPAAQITVLL